METMEYKGFRGTVEYSEEEDCHFGKVLGIRDMVSYEARTLARLQKVFRSAVDEYLLFYEEVESELDDW